MNEKDVLRILEAHIQSDRSKKCKCGWKPTWPDERIGAEYYQHREHLAEMIVELKLSEGVKLHE
jgi:hypothetical protein